MLAFTTTICTGLQVRPFRWQDEPQVLALWEACGLLHPDNDPHEDIVSKTTWQPDFFIVAELEGRVVATAMVGYEGHRGWINYLGVEPALQGTGIGRRMMSAAETLLREVGCRRANLMVRCTNQRVIPFYEKLGFAVSTSICLGKTL